MVGGEIVACVSEERFSRVKNDESYPLRSVEAVLTVGGVKPKELDLVVIAGERFDANAVLCHKYSKFSVKDRLKEQYQYWYLRLYQKSNISYLEVFKDKVDAEQYPGDWGRVIDFLKDGDQNKSNAFFQEFRRQTTARQLGIDPKKIIFVHHHLSHVYYAYYGSQIKGDRAVILTAEAWGDDKNASVSLAEDGLIRALSSSENFIVGRLYRHITLLLGMKPDEHEYKVMGLAAHAKPKYYKEPLDIFKNTMHVDDLGFAFREKPTDLYFYFRDKLEGYRFDSIAGAIQQYTEDILVEWTRNAIKASKSDRVCLGGGVAMNIKAAMEIAKLPEVNELFVCPSPSDESLAMGAAYVTMYNICRSRGQDPASCLKPLQNVYLAPKANSKEISQTVEEARLKGYVIRENPALDYVARLIADGKIIARCMDRGEFGARALGNRSILADPRRQDVVKVINEKVKNRDFWMPFAPSMLKERANKYLVNPKKLKAPYMTIAFDTIKEKWEDIKAATHQYDFTVRPQIVDKKANPDYHDLISEFYKLTGVGAVLNTSFNIHGEPIVQTPRDAVRVFELTDLDGLLLDGFLIERRGPGDCR